MVEIFVVVLNEISTVLECHFCCILTNRSVVILLQFDLIAVMYIML